jgi:hypothetical protein
MTNLCRAPIRDGTGKHKGFDGLSMLAQEVLAAFLGAPVRVMRQARRCCEDPQPGIHTSAGGKAALSTGSGLHRQQQDLSEISCATLGADLGWLRFRLCPFSRTWLQGLERLPLRIKSEAVAPGVCGPR